MRRFKTFAMLLVAALAAVATSCTKSSITGVAPKGVDADAYYVLYNEATNTPIDSVKAVEGTYKMDFSPVQKGDALYTLRISGTRASLFLVPEAGQITIDSNFFFAEGTPLNDKLTSLFKGLREIEEETMKKIDEAGDDSQKRSEISDKAITQCRDKVKAFFVENKEQPLCLAALNLYRNYDGSIESVKELLDMTGNRFDKYRIVTKLREQITQYEATQAGKQFIDLEGIQFTENGSQPIKLSEYVGQGQYAVVDFWASWCGPCKAEIASTLKPLYEKYRDKGLVVVGVVVWDQEENHKEIAKELGVTWPQIFDTEGTKLAAQYAVNSIPQILLIGPDGTILARDLRGEELVKAVESHFN